MAVLDQGCPFTPGPFALGIAPALLTVQNAMREGCSEAVVLAYVGGCVLVGRGASRAMRTRLNIGYRDVGARGAHKEETQESSPHRRHFLVEPGDDRSTASET